MANLIGTDQQDDKIDVPKITIAVPPQQEQPVAATPQQQVDVPQALRDSLAAPSGDITNGAIAPSPIQQDPREFTLPDSTPDPFAGAQDAVNKDLAATKEAGKYVLSPDQLAPLSYGLSQRDQQLQHWIDDTRNASFQLKPVEMPAMIGKPAQELDPSVAGGFKPTSQDKPWWGDFQPTTEVDWSKGKFGDFGTGLLPGIFQALNTPQAIAQGIGSDLARFGAGLVGGVEKATGSPDAGTPFKSLWSTANRFFMEPFGAPKVILESAVNAVKVATHLPDFVKGFQDNYSRLSPVATGQKPLSNLPSTNGLQRLRNQSFFVSGLTGRNLSATDESKDENQRFNPLGQRQAKGEKQAPSIISNVAARISAEAASVTSFAAGQGFLSKDQKEEVFKDVRTSQVGGFLRGIAIDIVSGEVVEKFVGNTLKKGIETFVVRTGKPLAEQAAKEAAEVIAKKPIVVGAKPNPYYKKGTPHLPPKPGDLEAITKAPQLAGTPTRKALPPTSSNPERTFVVKPGKEFRSAPDGLSQPSTVGVFKEGQLQNAAGSQPTKLVAGVPFKETKQFTLPGGKAQYSLPQASGRPLTPTEAAQTTLAGTPERAALPPISSNPDRIFVVKPTGIFEISQNGDAKLASQVGVFKDGELVSGVGQPTRLEAGVPFKEDRTAVLTGKENLALPEKSTAPADRVFVNDPATDFKSGRNAEVPLVNGGLTGDVVNETPKNALDLGEAKSRSIGQVADVPTREIQTVTPEIIPEGQVAKAADELIAGAPTNVASRDVARLRREVPIAEAQVYDPERYLDEWSAYVTPNAVDAVAFKVVPQEFLAGRVAAREVAGFNPTGLLDQAVEYPTKLTDTVTREVVPGAALDVQTIDVAARDVTEKRLMFEAPQRILDEGYQEAVPGVFLKPAPIKDLVGGASTPYGVAGDTIVTPYREVLQELPGVVKAEVFSPQLSLGDLADLVAKQQPGMTYNPAMVKRGQRKLDSMVSLAQKVTLPDGTPIIAAGTNGINTWAKFYNRIDFATASLTKEQKDAFKRIFTRDGVPLPNELPDTFAVQIKAAKVDAPEMVSVVSQPYSPPPVTSYKVDPASLKGATKKGWAAEQIDRLERTGNPDDLIEPDLTRDKIALAMYQKDLPNTLVSKSREGVKATNERLITENEISHLSEQSRNAKKDLAAISRQVDDELQGLDNVPDAAPRTLLTDPNADSLDELFMEADRVGNKYQTPEEIAAFNEQLSKVTQEVGDTIDQQFPDTGMSTADFGGNTPAQQRPVKPTKTSEQLATERASVQQPVPLNESAIQKKTRELKAKMEAYKATKAQVAPADNVARGLTEDLYHGTKDANLVGFDFNRKGEAGRNKLGDGVYFTRAESTAKDYAGASGKVITRPQGNLRKFERYHDFQQYMTEHKLDLTNVGKHFTDLNFDGVEVLNSSKGNGFFKQVVLYRETVVDLFHGSRVQDIEFKTVDPILTEPRGDLGVGIYVSKNVDEATSNAMADVKRNTPPVEDRVYGAANVSTINIKPEANLIDADAKMTAEITDIFVVQAERLLARSPDGDLAVASYAKALGKKAHTVAEAYALIEDKLLKASKKLYGTATLDEADVLKWQRAVAVELRTSGIDGVTHKTGVAIYNPEVITHKVVTQVGDTVDTLELAVHRFNADSLAVERHPESAYLKASLAETKVRVLGELQDRATELVKKTDGMLDTQVQRLLDIDKQLKGLARSEAIDRSVILAKSEETAYEGFVKELNTVNDTPCL